MTGKLIKLLIIISAISAMSISTYAMDTAKIAVKDIDASGITDIQKNINQSKVNIDSDTTKVSLNKTMYRYGKHHVSSRDLIYRPKKDKINVDDLIYRPGKDKLNISDLNISTKNTDIVNNLKLNSECSTSNISE